MSAPDDPRPAHEVLREFAPGSSGVLDARKRFLGVGDEIILTVPGPIYFRVADIVPNLHPEAPPGLMTVHLLCAVAFAVQRGAVNPEFLRIRTAQEAGPMNVKVLDEGGDK